MFVRYVFSFTLSPPKYGLSLIMIGDDGTLPSIAKYKPLSPYREACSALMVPRLQLNFLSQIIFRGILGSNDG
jgi:hypothetical protein